jgi:hypothetical protein
VDVGLGLVVGVLFGGFFDDHETGLDEEEAGGGFPAVGGGKKWGEGWEEGVVGGWVGEG